MRWPVKINHFLCWERFQNTYRWPRKTVRKTVFRCVDARPIFVAMPANKYAQLRYRIIDRCLTNKHRPYPSKEDLRSACEEELYGSVGQNISLSTIDKDLYAMRNELNLGYNAPIAYNRYHKGYEYTDPEYSIDQFPLREDDVEAIELAAATLAQFRGISIFESSQDAIEKILARLRLRPEGENDDESEHVLFDRAPAYRGGEHLSVLLKAIREHLVVQFDYAKYSGEETKRYTLHPYLLKEYRNRWYVVGQNPERNAVVIFGLDRVENKVEVSGETFVRDPDFDTDRYFRHSMGITALDKAPEKIRLRFSELSGKYVESRPWHTSQKVVKNDAEGLDIELYLCISKELVMEILGFGGDVEVLEPKSLRLHLAQELRNAIEKYS